MPLESKEVEKVFAECFLFIDYENPKWNEELNKYLSMPYSEIKKIWTAKKEYRDKYDNVYFMSKEKNAGKLGANFIINNLKGFKHL